MTVWLMGISFVSGNVAAQKQVSKTPWKTQMDRGSLGMFKKSSCADRKPGRDPGATREEEGQALAWEPWSWFQSCQTESCLLCHPVSQRGVLLALLSSQVMPWVASPRSGPQLQSRGAGRPGIKQRGRVLGSLSGLAAAEQSHVPTRGRRGWGGRADTRGAPLHQRPTPPSSQSGWRAAQPRGRWTRTLRRPKDPHPARERPPLGRAGAPRAGGDPSLRPGTEDPLTGGGGKDTRHRARGVPSPRAGPTEPRDPHKSGRPRLSRGCEGGTRGGA